jgi:hypothetical protein
MNDQLNSLKQLVKHAVKLTKVITHSKKVQEPINVENILKVILENDIVDIPSKDPQPSFINKAKFQTPVEASRQIVTPTPVEASRHEVKPIPTPRRINIKTEETPIEILVDTDISFAIRLPVPQLNLNMEDERTYLREVIGTLEATEIERQTPKQKYDLRLYRQALENLVPVKKPKPELSVVARPGVKFNRDGLPKAFKTSMDTEEHIRQFKINCATNGYKDSDEKMAIFNMTLAKLEADWYKTCSANTIDELSKEFEERFGTTNHRSKALR